MGKVKVFKPKQVVVIMLPNMTDFRVSIGLHPHQKWRCEKESAYNLSLTNGCVRMVIGRYALSHYFKEVGY